MKKKYRLPLVGKVLDDEPLTGDENNPLATIDIDLLPGFDSLSSEEQAFCLVNLEYDVDGGWGEVEIGGSEALHSWLGAALENIDQIYIDSGWNLDKTELEKARLARKKEER
jgi:hypothetical protein